MPSLTILSMSEGKGALQGFSSQEDLCHGKQQEETHKNMPPLPPPLPL